MNFLEALALLFIALKLTNFIDWSWWVVLIPLYPITLSLFFVTLGWLVVRDNTSIVHVLKRILN